MTTNKNLTKVVRTDTHGVTLEDMSQYNQALFNVLDNCRDLVEYAENKRAALWLFASVLQSLSWTVYSYDTTVKAGLEITKQKNVPERQREYWMKRLLDAEKERVPVDLWQKFGEIYEKQVIDYTSDNLDNLTQNLPMLEDMLRKHASAKTQKEEVKEKQELAAIEDLAKRLQR